MQDGKSFLIISNLEKDLPADAIVVGADKSILWPAATLRLIYKF